MPASQKFYISAARGRRNAILPPPNNSKSPKATRKSIRSPIANRTCSGALPRNRRSAKSPHARPFCSMRSRKTCWCRREPYQPEHVRGSALRQHQRQDQQRRSRGRHRVFGPCQKTQRPRSPPKPPHYFNKICGLKNSGCDCRERPRVSKPARRARGRQAHINPVRKPQIVCFKHKPQRHRQHPQQHELAGRIAQPRMSRDCIDGRIGQKNIGRPRDRSEPGRGRFHAAQHQRRGRHQSRQRQPSVDRQRTRTVPQKSCQQQAHRRRRNGKSQENHVGMLAHRALRTSRPLRARASTTVAAKRTRANSPGSPRIAACYLHVQTKIILASRLTGGLA